MLLAITFDPTVTLSDIITSVVVPVIGIAVVKAYKSLTKFVEGVGEIGDVVDEHTDVLTKAGWLKGKELPRVGPAKKRHRVLWGVALLALWAPSASAQAVLPTLRDLRPSYPTPMSKTQIADLLNRAAATHGWRMLRKDAGNNCPTPYPGVSISCDWLFDPAINWGWDVIRDQEGVGSIEATGDGALQPGQELVMPWSGVPPTPPPSVPVPPAPVPSLDLGQLVARLDALYAQQERMFADRNNRIDGIQAELKGLHEDYNSTAGAFFTFVGKYILPPLGAAIGTWLVAK